MSGGGRAPVRVAVIGLGTIADEHLKAYRDSPEAELVAVCDIFAERAAQRAPGGLVGGMRRTREQFSALHRKHETAGLRVLGRHRPYAKLHRFLP